MLILFITNIFYQLADLDVISAIEMLIEKKQWEKALETAQQQKVCLICCLEHHIYR